MCNLSQGLSDTVKEFTTTGICNPEKHYMVDISERLKEIKGMVDAGKYFCINRARQYGKTTTLSALRKYLSPLYEVISVSFQGIGESGFRTEENFVQSFCRLLRKQRQAWSAMPDQIMRKLEGILEREANLARLDELFEVLSDWCVCSDKLIVLMIDEVDSASNNQVFLDFLAQLRDGYLEREANPKAGVFQSVILAGVTDIKHLKSRIRPEDTSKFNSPWNIAADFDIDMSLPADGICGMLDEYEMDHHTGMNTSEIAREIYDFTEGYPFLVSRICQKMAKRYEGGRSSGGDMQNANGGSACDDVQPGVWSLAGVSEAVRDILMEKNTLFDSLMGKVYDNHDLSDVLQRILFGGDRIPYNPDSIPAMDGEMYGFVKNRDGALGIANRIFETRLYNYFLSVFEMKDSPMSRAGASERDRFISKGHLDMESLLKHYAVVFGDVYEEKAEPFDEEEGRRRFLLFIRPVINGTGNYYIETRTRDDKRMDLVIDYLGERYVIEMKIWRGIAYHEKGEVQLAGYLDSYHLDTGYMLTYSFNQKKNKGITYRVVNGKKLIEAIV